jgi:glycosyltransferase involved in cell wall biosynthesis
MYPPMRTGTSFYSKCLAQTLADAGHHIVVITTAKDVEDGLGDHHSRFVCLRSIHIPLKNFFKHLHFCSLFPMNYFKVYRTVKSVNPDVILLVNHYLDIAFPAIFASRLNDKPLFISVGTQLQSSIKLKDKVLNVLDRLVIGLFIFPFAQSIVAWDKEIARYIREIHSRKNFRKVAIIHYGPVGFSTDVRDYKHDYSRTGQILSVGAVSEQRNYLFEIMVFNELVKIFPHLKFLIIGHIYFKKPLQLVETLGLQDSVFFTGELSHDRVLEEMKKSTVHWMMLNARYVGLGTANVEAMSLGLPVVSNIPENLFDPHILTDMTSYIKTDGKNVSVTLDKIKLLLQDRSLRKKIGMNGKKFVQEYLNWEKIVQNYFALFRHTMRKRSFE